MAKKKRTPSTSSDDPDEQIVVVCRGGDCGSRMKHPGFDHQNQLRSIRQSAPSATRIVVSRCLDACEHSNVIVVLPPADTPEHEAVWIGGANDGETTQDIVRWLRAGSPYADRPALVEIRQFSPTRLNRRELDEEIHRSRRP